MDILEFLPMQDEMSAEALAKYVAVVLMCCAADGLSDLEQTAVKNWIQDHKGSPSVFDTALAMMENGNIDISESEAKVFGPYLIRDCIRLAKADGLSPEEYDTIVQTASQLGYDEDTVKTIQQVISLHEITAELWKSVTK